MKLKSLIASMCLLCLGYTASAQMYGGSSASTSVSSAPGITTGLRLGVTFSSINTSMDGVSVESENLAGFQIGFFSNFAVNQNFSIQPELLLVQKGGSYGEGSEKVDLKANYLEVPVLAKASFGTGSLVGFVTAGPTLGYWLSGTVEDEYESLEIDFEDEGANRLEAGLSLGAGAAYNNFSLDVRYGLGLTSIFDEGDVLSKNRVIGVSLGYLFGM